MSRPAPSDGEERRAAPELRPAQPQLLPRMPQAGGEPVFAEPWMAQAFALALQLHRHGLFEWPEFASALATAIEAAQRAGDADLGDTYYHHWLAALEALVVAKGAGSAVELHRTRGAWERAAHRTPHGTPIELQPDDFGR